MIAAIDVETIPATMEPDDYARLAKRHADADREFLPELVAPLARVVSIAVVAIGEKDARRFVVYDSSIFSAVANGSIEIEPIEDLHVLACEGEAGVLQSINDAFVKMTRVVTWSGRGYDLPVIVHRSIINGVECGRARGLMNEYRYKPDKHYDLLDLMSGFGAASYRGMSLDAVCVGYGIPSPKRHTSGAGVREMVEAGELRELLTYNVGDAEATLKLYAAWV